MWQSELRTENPPSNPTQPAKQARTVHQALLLSAPATTGKPVCSAVTFSIIKERLGVCSAVSVFIETNDLIKFQFRSKLPRAKAARFFFPFFTPGIRPPSWKLANLLWNSWVTSAELEGVLDRIRRWIAEATRQIHVPYHPFSCERFWHYTIHQMIRAHPLVTSTHRKLPIKPTSPNRSRCFLQSILCH